MSYKDYIDSNRKNWNERTKIHAKDTDYYNIEAFKGGELSFRANEQDDLRDVTGKSLLHLQCHFGLDTMSWSRLGARATGVDISEEAIALARELASELDLDTEFVCSDIYDLGDNLDGEFDIVFASVGTVGWLPDLGGWARIIARFLKRGGTFYIKDSHPISNSLLAESDQLVVGGEYFRSEPYMYDDGFTYAGDEDLQVNTTNYQWHHSMGSIIQSLIEAGLVITEFREYPHAFYYRYGDLEMSQNSEGMWELPDHLGNTVPLSYKLLATKQ